MTTSHDDHDLVRIDHEDAPDDGGPCDCDRCVYEREERASLIARAVARVAFAVADNEGHDAIRILHAIRDGDDMEVGTPTYTAIATALTQVSDTDMYTEILPAAYDVLEDALREASEWFNS